MINWISQLLYGEDFYYSERPSQTPLEETPQPKDEYAKYLYPNVIFLMDRSNNMRYSNETVTKTFNNTIDHLVDTMPSSKISVFIFDSTIENTENLEPVSSISPLLNYENTDEGSSLFDCIGSVIEQYQDAQNIIFFIFTSGVDTLSKKYTYEDIKEQLSNLHKDKNWDVVCPINNLF